MRVGRSQTRTRTSEPAAAGASAAAGRPIGSATGIARPTRAETLLSVTTVGIMTLLAGIRGSAIGCLDLVEVLRPRRRQQAAGVGHEPVAEFAEALGLGPDLRPGMV